jgi:hypothetical protein
MIHPEENVLFALLQMINLYSEKKVTKEAVWQNIS